MPNADFTQWMSPSAVAEAIAFLVSDQARDVPGVSLLSQVGDKSAKQRAFDAGFDAHLTKPADPHESVSGLPHIQPLESGV
jgi:CheY-like chemotaxis protein